MKVQSTHELQSKKCASCAGGVERYSLPLVKQQLEELSGWRLTNDDQRIRKDWNKGNFLECLAFFEAVGKIAEQEAHHPDLHLESYRKVWIEIWTHDIGGLSENDFILAAKIDALGDQS